MHRPGLRPLCEPAPALPERQSSRAQWAAWTCLRTPERGRGDGILPRPAGCRQRPARAG
ncbi:MAG: hypothetical protein ACK56F_06485 [bacterium]